MTTVVSEQDRIDHVRRVEGLVRALTPGAALTFGLVVADRVLPEYKAACEQIPEADVDPVVEAIRLAWFARSKDQELPQGTAALCRKSLPTVDSTGSSQAIAIAMTLGNGIADLLEEVENGNPYYANFIAARAIEVFEILEDDGTAQESIDRWMKAEMGRQLRWLEAAHDASTTDLSTRPTADAFR